MFVLAGFHDPSRPTNSNLDNSQALEWTACGTGAGSSLFTDYSAFPVASD